MSPYSSEELVSRNFVLDEKPKAIINIIDATNIERNLYLTVQLLVMQIPLVAALNVMDERKTALTGKIPLTGQKKPKRYDLQGGFYFCGEEDHNGAVHRAIHAIANLIQDHAERAGLPRGSPYGAGSRQAKLSRMTTS